MTRFFSLSFLAFVVACSSNNSSNTSTSAASAKTVDGVCAKLDALACAQPNCTGILGEAQRRCTGPSDDFQGFLDCMASASFQCGGSPNIPRTAQCEADIARVNACASEPVTSHAGNGGDGGIPSFDASPPSETCATAADCTPSDCLCADGTFVSFGECKSNKCTDIVSLCAVNDAAFVAACKDHGGTN